jgi:hypothetical protein
MIVEKLSLLLYNGSNAPQEKPMIQCQICREENEERCLFCRRCLAGIRSPALGEDYRNEHVELLRQACSNYAGGLLPHEYFIAHLQEMRHIVAGSAASLEAFAMTEELRRDVGKQMSLIAEGLLFFNEGLDALSSLGPEATIETLARGLTMAEKGNHLLNEGLKIIDNQEAKDRLFASSFHGAWLDAVKDNCGREGAPRDPARDSQASRREGA